MQCSVSLTLINQHRKIGSVAMRAHHSDLSRYTGTGRSLRTCRTALAPCIHDTTAKFMQQPRQACARGRCSDRRTQEVRVSAVARKVLESLYLRRNSIALQAGRVGRPRLPVHECGVSALYTIQSQGSICHMQPGCGCPALSVLLMCCPGLVTGHQQAVEVLWLPRASMSEMACSHAVAALCQPHAHLLVTYLG